MMPVIILWSHDINCKPQTDNKVSVLNGCPLWLSGSHPNPVAEGNVYASILCSLAARGCVWAFLERFNLREIDGRTTKTNGSSPNWIIVFVPLTGAKQFQYFVTTTPVRKACQNAWTCPLLLPSVINTHEEQGIAHHSIPDWTRCRTSALESSGLTFAQPSEKVKPFQDGLQINLLL